LTYEPALPFSQKSFAMQNLFGNPTNKWCPRCVFHTPKSATLGQGYFVHRCCCNGLTYEPALPFSQKSFAMQNLFGNPNNIWCPRCVFHTPKSATSGQGYFVHRCYCNGLTYEPALPFSQKSFVSQNIFGNPNNIWCPRCVFHTPKSTKSTQPEAKIRLGYFLS